MSARPPSISIVSPDDLDDLAAIERLIKKKIERVLVPGYEPDLATLTALLGKEASPCQLAHQCLVDRWLARGYARTNSIRLWQSRRWATFTVVVTPARRPVRGWM